MTTAYLTHPDCLQHITPPGHPERVDRLIAIEQALKAPEFDALDRHEAPMGQDAHILTVHPQDHLDAIKAASPADGWKALDGDTHMSPGSLRAAYRGVGAMVEAVDRVLTGDANNAFVACRPPGHHAETRTPMGFCYFGNVVIGAKHALDHHGLDRVAIVDFDVHHGNGTQDLVWNDPRMFFASTHQMPLYPGTGAQAETGGSNNVMNVPLPPNSGGEYMQSAFKTAILPAVRRHNPQMIFVSAGFDAHANDPLANLNWTDEDFAWATRALCDLADEICDGRLVSTLEGGYDLDGLAGGVAAHLRVLMEH